MTKESYQLSWGDGRGLMYKMTLLTDREVRNIGRGRCHNWPNALLVAIFEVPACMHTAPQVSLSSSCPFVTEVN